MNTEEIKEELKSVYHGHDEFEEIISAVDGTGHLVYWAGRLTSDEFGKNKKLARELYKIALERIDGDVEEEIYIAKNIASNDLLGDKEWSKTLFHDLLGKTCDPSDLIVIADSFAIHLGDLETAKEIYIKAREAANQSCQKFYVFKELAKSIFKYLGDNAWAKEIVNSAVLKFPSCENYRDAAVLAGTHNQLNDMSWSKELFISGQKLAETRHDFRMLGWAMANFVDFSEPSEENDEKFEWAYDNYIVAFYLGCLENDDFARKDNIKEIKYDMKKLGVGFLGAKPLKVFAVEILKDLCKEHLIKIKKGDKL